MKVRVFYHDKCFDGACSAALFSRVYRECVRREAQFEYIGLVHRAGALFDESQFTGDENAIVDFKYSASPKITWWFDHHQSAFLTAADQEHFRRDASGKKFFDPEYKSCTKFIADTSARVFGFDPKPVAEMVHWADVIDGALYPDAPTAVEITQPAMKLTMVLETNQDDAFPKKLIPLLAERPLAEIIEQPFVAERIPALLERHEKSIEIMRKHSECVDGTVYFDVTGYDLEGYSKFIPYYLHPESTYSVGLSKSSFRTKVSIGSNPWTKTRPEDMVNLAHICERYGGGGHARVGAISFPPDRADEARKAGKEVVDELRAAMRAVASKRGTS
ncbi:MAG: phosphoesterase [Acidobacteriales bacterium]|nr:phosphoesterase [Terriglobales bacterium]